MGPFLWPTASVTDAKDIACQICIFASVGWDGRRREEPRLSFCVPFSPVLSQAESWQRQYNDTRSLFPVVLEQLDDYNAKLSDLQESLDQALNHVRDAEDMNRATAARQRDHEVQWTLNVNAFGAYINTTRSYLKTRQLVNSFKNIGTFKSLYLKLSARFLPLSFANISVYN